MAQITVHLTARTSEQAQQPVLYRLVKDFHVVPNIRKADVGEDHAFVILDLEGAVEEVQRAIAWLHTTGLGVDPKQRSVSPSANT